jgi:integrase
LPSRSTRLKIFILWCQPRAPSLCGRVAARWNAEPPLGFRQPDGHQFHRSPGRRNRPSGAQNPEDRRDQAHRFTPEIRALLEQIGHVRKLGCPFLFPSTRSATGYITNVDDEFATVFKTAKLKDVVVHDLRRSLISFGIVQGSVALENMAKTIGHADAATTEGHFAEWAAPRTVASSALRKSRSIP